MPSLQFEAVWSRSAVLVVAIVAALLGTAGCGDPTPIPPRSPVSGAEASSEHGAFASRTPSPPVELIPTHAATRVVAPLEPLELPDGFGASVFAEPGLPVAGLAVAPNGDVFASVPTQDRILVFTDRDSDGLADNEDVIVYAEGGVLSRPYGLAFDAGWLYVGCTDAVLRFPYSEGDIAPSGPGELLAELPSGGDHWARPIAIGPGPRLYVGVGSACNACQPDDARRATVLQMGLDGAEPKLFSSGLRSPWGLAINPANGDVWAGDRGREGLGDDRPPDELNRLNSGAHFGWPHCYGQGRFDSVAGGKRNFCANTVGPMLELQAHSGVSGLLFYDGLQFPEAYRGDLYVALTGSAARRGIPTGYNIVRVPLSGWAPRGEVFDFVSGWLRPDTRRWGSPVDLVMAPDGALLVSDDGGGRIYRIYYWRQHESE